MTPRVRLIVLTVFVVAVVALAGTSIGRMRRAEQAATSGPAVTVIDLAGVLAEPHVVFRSTALGPDYGRLGAAPLDHPERARAMTALSCERSYATATAGVCVTATRGMVPTYAVVGLDAGLRQVTSVPLAGLPSRARMSSDGSLVATTTFVTGHSYAQSSFSTDTVVRRGGSVLGNLESFTTIVDGHELKAVDRNFWGVTFARDDDTFYATASTGGTTWLVRGSFSRRQMEALHTDAECPSLSPDGTKIAYKKRLGSSKPGQWRLAVLDLGTGVETELAETRSVDDQVEWLDDQQVLYTLSRDGAEGTISDIWSTPADGSGMPTVYMSEASSPAVIADGNRP